MTAPAVVLADEPTGALDSRTAAGVLALLRSCVDELGQTVVMVTHDPVAASYADRVAFLVDGRVAGSMDAPTAEAVAGQLAHLDDLGVGVMSTLAWASLRHRPSAFVATFLAVLFGTAMIGSFATLVETATGPVSAADGEALTIMGAVVGGWGSAIVLFSVASTLAVTVRQRETEVGLLRAIGATPRQARRLIRVEALLVTLLAAVGGALVASVGGRALLAMLRSGDMVASDVEYGGGPASLGAAAGLVVLTAMVAAAITARRATRGPATVVLRDSGTDTAGCAGGGSRRASS